MEKGTPIQRKLMRVIMMTCGTVLLLTCAAFFIYEFITYRDISKRELSVLGRIIAANSTASLAFDSKGDADEILSALRAEPQIVAAGLYDKNGKLYAYYPRTLDTSALPATAQSHDYRFRGRFLEGYQPVVQEQQQLGTLYLRSDMRRVYHRFALYSFIAVVFIAFSILIAYLISKQLQKSISTPILELAKTATLVSEKRDYSVRASTRSKNELGTLTDAFNHMLTQIQLQSQEIRTLNAGLEEKVDMRTRELQDANNILKQQNEFIETIIDSSIDLIAVFNKNMEYVTVNKKAGQVYKKGGKLIGRHILDVFPVLAGSPMVDGLQRALKGELVHLESYRSKVSDRYFENFFIPLKDKDGNTDRVLVVGHDLTNVMQANEKLKQLNAELEKSNRELEQFAYVASHDLQEPLRKIQIFSELSARNTHNAETLNRYLEKINHSAARMSELIQAVLNYSRLSRSDKEFKEVDLNQVLRNIQTDLELVIEEKKAVIHADELPVIRGNALQLHQLFLNLISNSLKFNKRTPEITITARNRDGKWLELAFSDNGIGFDQQYADQIFAIFQRLHSGSEYAGTGIGLALCKRIVEYHEGTITAESTPGAGTTFYVNLPSSLLVQQREESRVDLGLKHP
ncbi:MAG TPA: ATP-binding protein [Chitinophagaceae bacterium]|nr:ATP-binding protein [Chitinophagaceae bacterium]